MSTSKFHKVQNTTGLYRYGSQEGYYARIKIHGKLIVKKLNSNALRNAKIEVSRLREKHGKVKPGKGAKTLLAVAREYLGTIRHRSNSTQVRARGIVDKLELWEHSAKAIGKVAPSEIKTWLGKITKGLSKDSYNKHLAVLRQIFDTALKDGRLFESPLQEVKTVAPDEPARPCPTWKKAWAIVKDIRAQRYNADAVDSGDFVEFMLLSGLGNGEAAALRWEDVDFAKNQIHVTRLKTRKKYPVPMFPSLREFLTKLPKDNPDGRVLTISNARRAITNACERLGLPHCTQRSFRRCFITRAVEKGIDFKAISSWQGHQDGGVLIARTYSHLNDEHSQKMAQRL